MFDIVNRLLEQYVGGQIFFTELDNAVKFNEKLIRELHTLLRHSTTHPLPLTIASGEFGLSLHNLSIPVDFLVPGGLRHDPSKINLKPFEWKIKNQTICFLDDSFFSGRTALVVKEEVERLGGIWGGIYVIYDGSKEKGADGALYRYYDHFDTLGRPLNKDV